MKHCPSVILGHAGVIVEGSRGTKVSEREIERVRANICQRAPDRQRVRIADIEVLLRRT